MEEEARDKAGEQEPTLSPPTNVLLKMAQEVIEGKGDPEQLEQSFKERQAGLEAAIADFEGRLEKETNEDFHADFEQEIADVRNGFEEYQAALVEMENFFKMHDTGFLKSSSIRLVSATKNLIEAIQRFEGKYWITGPTQFPVLNALIKTADALKEGKLPPEILPPMTQNARHFFQVASKELDHFKDTPARDSVNSLKKAYDLFISGIDEMRKFVDDRDSSHLERGIQILTTAHQDIDEGFKDFQKQMYLSGPSESPFANLVINAADGVLEGIYPPEILEGSLRILMANYNKMKNEIKSASMLKIDSVAIKEELDRVMATFEELDQVIQEYYLYLQDQDESHLHRARNGLARGMEELHKSYMAFMEISDREGKINCLKCGHPNPITAKNCEQCAAPLPRFAGEATASTFHLKEGAGEVVTQTGGVITENIHRLIEVTNRVADGLADKIELEETIRWLEDLVENARVGLSAQPDVQLGDATPEEIEQREREKEVIDETRGVLADALDDFQAGLNRMRKYMEEEDKDHLIRGLQQVYVAAQDLVQVVKIGELAEKSTTRPEQEESSVQTLVESFHTEEEE
ncbi:MAG: zinc ribbon domain-containing protein [Candidatus Eremiobacteraeota bacterium]|nr:zinc ribbon domain-containing protein [Candidatus Eremiobacteraeota bacterium]